MRWLMLWLIPMHVYATLEQCQLDCTRNATERSIHRVSRSPTTRPYPYAVADNPNPYPEFCQLGCSYWYSTSPHNVSCKARCDYTYRYNLSVGYSDWAEVARWECRDGCDMGLARCQPGYYCANGNMTICPPGTWRSLNYSQVQGCNLCEKGRYRAMFGGTSMESCTKCPQGTYVNITGATQSSQCLRCPDGKFGPEPGMALCKCITPRSCDPQWENFQSESIPFIGRW